MSASDEVLPDEEGDVAGPNPDLRSETAGGDGASSEAGVSGVAGNGSGAESDGHSTALAEEADPREVLARERDEYLMALQRTQADFENYRKRVSRLQEEQAARATGGLVDKLLPALDALDLAEAHLIESHDATDDGKALRASRAILLDILGKEGLERIDRADVPFDPSVHEAVAHSEAEGDDAGETVVEEVLRSGYRWKGLVLRAAMVRVRG